MTDKYADLRAALDAVPCVKWTASRSTVHIPETEDWAGKGLSITGLDKQVARKLARYIADTNPVVIRALLAEKDALIHDNSEYVSAANELATENQRLREALEQYADPNNWEKDEFGWRRIWREPGSKTPESYDGSELAFAALAQAHGEKHDNQD